MPTPTSSPLDYAPAPPLRRRRWVRRAVVFVLLAVVSLGGYRWGRPFVRQARLLYWQRQCLRYHPPADLVVYDEDPLRAAPLIQRGGEYFAASPRWWFRRTGVSPIAAHCPACYGRLSLAIGNPAPADAILYLGERTSHTGVRRLVVVTCNATKIPSLAMANSMDVETATIAGWGGAQGLFTDRPQTSSSFTGRIITASAGDEPLVRFFAGQPDPADAAAFTLQYDLDGVPGTLRGTLVDNGGWVEWAQPSSK
jgi:hypothetical protein